MGCTLHQRDVVERNEIVALELVRTQSLSATRLSLLRLLEQDGAGRWLPVTPSLSIDELFAAIARLRVAEAEAARLTPSPHRRNLMCRGDSRERQLGVPHATLETWIARDLRPRGFLQPSTGPGRPRRDARKYALGPYFAEHSEALGELHALPTSFM